MAHELLPLSVDVLAVDVLKEKMQRLSKVPYAPEIQNRPSLDLPPHIFPWLPFMGGEGAGRTSEPTSLFFQVPKTKLQLLSFCLHR